MGADKSKKPDHPAGLYVLFGAEMWERFSYLRDEGATGPVPDQAPDASPAPDALDVYAIYTSLVYLTPLLGGYLADQVPRPSASRS